MKRRCCVVVLRARVFAGGRSAGSSLAASRVAGRHRGGAEEPAGGVPRADGAAARALRQGLLRRTHRRQPAAGGGVEVDLRRAAEAARQVRRGAWGGVGRGVRRGGGGVPPFLYAPTPSHSTPAGGGGSRRERVTSGDSSLLPGLE
eukprot:CAMPEP_0113249626 /NCGR_PEP_ID=MMETSP0008_2-20120614/11154_1 /TAXON_ID=97485 /ORGANISM="Prymnesium parvum" /LENGTH=145 /DNA_ID=CAMNT_0000097561 /DNA_START=194 /DNA_END=631 /DNA_ORIENTATION=+ /assembly_acc=CAM_ASM_000153